MYCIMNAGMHFSIIRHPTYFLHPMLSAPSSSFMLEQGANDLLTQKKPVDMLSRPHAGMSVEPHLLSQACPSLLGLPHSRSLHQRSL